MTSKWLLFSVELTYQIFFPVYNLYFWLNISEFTQSFKKHSFVGIVFTIVISLTLIVILVINQVTNYNSKYNILVHIKYSLFLLGIINISMFLSVMKKVVDTIMFGLAGIISHFIIIILAKLESDYRSQIKQRKKDFSLQEMNNNKNEKNQQENIQENTNVEEQINQELKKGENIESSISTITN